LYHIVPCFGCSGRLWPDSAGFAFEPCALADPTAIMGPISDTVVISHDA
jgi:hypothetical protein